MQCYLDSSALLKRVVPEAETSDLEAFLKLIAEQGVRFLTSALSQVEVARSLRRAASDGRVEAENFQEDFATVFRDVNIVELTEAILYEARGIDGDKLRSLDAIHLAAAHLAGADMVVTYDDRMFQACLEGEVMTARPGAQKVPLPPGWEWVTGDDPADVPDELWEKDW